MRYFLVKGGAPKNISSEGGGGRHSENFIILSMVGGGGHHFLEFKGGVIEFCCVEGEGQDILFSY